MSPQSDGASNKGRGEKRERKKPGPKFDPKLGNDIVVAMRLGITIDTAAMAAGVRRQTYYNWRRRARRSDADPALKKWAEDIRGALAFSERYHVQKINQAADKGVWQASAWLLERRMPEKYGRREHVEHSGGVDGAPSKIVLHLPSNGRDVDADGEVVDPTEGALPNKSPEPADPADPAKQA